MQRLFSSFADGWPGAGLLIQRLLIGAILLHRIFLQPLDGIHFTTVLLPLIASVLLVIGLGTPYVGVLVAAKNMWFVLFGLGDIWSAMIVCGLGVSLAMIGPGAWSVDAQIFGRKHIEVVRR